MRVAIRKKGGEYDRAFLAIVNVEAKIAYSSAINSMIGKCSVFFVGDIFN